MQKKLKLETFNIQSFTTSIVTEEAKRVAGGLSDIFICGTYNPPCVPTFGPGCPFSEPNCSTTCVTINYGNCL